MVNDFSRRRALAVLCGTALTGMPQQALARPVIKLPNDIVNSDIATITAVRTPSPVVAMTFDDGPHPRNTPYLLDILRERGIKATFYVIGDRVVT